MTGITPCLWFDDNLEEALAVYAGIFPDLRVETLQRTGGEDAKAFSASFEMAGQKFIAINGGPHFRFNEAVSFVIDCADQAEVDRYWDALIADGGAESRCGWLKDRFGLSWQVIPAAFHETVGGPDPEGAKRATEAMLQMTRLIVEDLRRAYAGG